MRCKGSAKLRFLVIVLIALLVFLQARLWFSEDGYREVVRLEGRVDAQLSENARLEERNARLDAEVSDLKGGNSAVEERARADLGMVVDGETFYLFGESESPISEK
jgi:cell division protein FtsB